MPEQQARREALYEEQEELMKQLADYPLRRPSQQADMDPKCLRHQRGYHRSSVEQLIVENWSDDETCGELDASVTGPIAVPV